MNIINNKFFHFASCAIINICLISPAFAQNQDTSPSSIIPPHLLELDKDNDKKISRAEAKGPVITGFDILDKNKDNFVSFEELEEFISSGKPLPNNQQNNQQSLNNQQRPPQGNRGGGNRGGESRGGERGNQPPRPPAMFLEMDKNNDRQISRSEATGEIAIQFDKLDKNKDNFLSLDELREARDILERN